MLTEMLQPCTRHVGGGLETIHHSQPHHMSGPDNNQLFANPFDGKPDYERAQWHNRAASTKV